MYHIFLIIHTWLRWGVLVSLVFTMVSAFINYKKKAKYTITANSLRHWTATLAHIQLMVGFVLYFKSPTVQYYWHNTNTNIKSLDTLFFSVLHLTLMLVAIIVITIGSAKAKRIPTDSDKYKTTGIWFAVALLIIFLAIPWPFSPLANRPLIRY